MSTIKTDRIEAYNNVNQDLVLTGKGTGAVDVQSGLKVSEDATLSGKIVLDGATGNDRSIVSAAGTAAHMSGGSVSDLGGNVTFYGQSHATQAGDIKFRDSSTHVLYYDSSASTWDFSDNDLVTTGSVNVGGSTPPTGSKLRVSNSEPFHQTLRVDQNNTAYNNDIYIYHALSNTNSLVSKRSDGDFWIYNGASEPIKFFTSSTLRGQFNTSGDFEVTGKIVLDGSLTHLVNGSSTTATHVSGGTTSSQGGNVVFYGQSHATNAGDIIFRDSSATALHYDSSASAWYFADNNVYIGGEIVLDGAAKAVKAGDSTGATIISGGTSSNIGGNVLFYGQSHAGSAGDILFRDSSTNVLRYDSSASHWDFHDNDIRTAGEIILDGGSKHIKAGDNTGGVVVSGGTYWNLGGSVVFHGESHPAHAKDIIFRDSGTDVLHYDSSANLWYFADNDIHTSGKIVLDGANKDIRAGDSTGGVAVSGGTASNLGSNVTFYGQSHATVAGDIRFRDSGVVSLYYDSSSSNWNFQDNDIRTGGEIVLTGVAKNIKANDSTTGVAVSGGTASNQGSNVTFYGQSHATQAGDIKFRDSGTNVLYYASSANLWDFADNDIHTSGKIVLDGTYRNVISATSDAGVGMSGGSDRYLGGNVSFYGESHPTQAGDIIFRDSSATALHYDSSGSYWNFAENDVHVGGKILLKGIERHILSGDSTGAITVSGGTASNLGGNVVFYGESHSTLAGDIAFRNSSANVLYYNSSDNTFNFHNNEVYSPAGIYIGGTAAANHLDDYEEGTWSPSIAFGGSSAGVTSTASDGWYVKIGRIVHVGAFLNLSSTGTATGDAALTGLPFTVANQLSGTAVESAAIVPYITNENFTHDAYASFENNTTHVTFWDGQNNSPATHSNFTNTTGLRLSGTYYTTA